MEQGPSWFWSVRWHIARLVVGSPSHFLAGLGDGARAFRRAFFGAWDSRWKASDRDEFWRRQRRAKSTQRRSEDTP